MIISVINHTAGLLSDAQVQTAIRAINRQIAEDFAPHWGMSATLRLEGHSRRSMTVDPAEARGDAVLYLWHPVDVPNALGFHTTNFLGIPFGYVFPAFSQRIGEPWTVTLSHEALEMIADPDVNLLVMGPHPRNPSRTVFHWYEVCDSVQNERYEVDGIPVSNFLLPLFFTSGEETASRNDFLGARRSRGPLRSFGVAPGGYVGYYDPVSAQHEIYFAEGDVVSLERLLTKNSLGLTRRSQRYQALTARNQSIDASLRQYLRGS